MGHTIRDVKLVIEGRKERKLRVDNRFCIR